MINPNIARTLGSLLFCLFLCLWRWNGFLRDLISILRIYRSTGDHDIVEHRRVSHVCSFYSPRIKRKSTISFDE